MKPFTKLFSSIVTSSIWTEDAPTKVVWVTMLALADADGDVWASVGGLAQTAGVTRDQCEHALAKFLAPDPDSRTRELEGRRIVVTDGGWHLVNYRKYREMGRAEDRREYFANKKREQRSRQQMSTPVHTCPQSSTASTMSTDIEAKAEANKTTTTPTPSSDAPDKPARNSRKKLTTVADSPPTLAEVEAFVAEIGGTIDAAEFIDANAVAGWTHSGGRKPVLDWRAHYRRWMRFRTERAAAEAPEEIKPPHWDEAVEIDRQVRRERAERAAAKAKEQHNA